MTAALAAAAGVVWVWSGAAAWLVYDRAAIHGGEVWRLWTGHIVHFSPSHLAWNLLIFVPAGAWLERRDPVAMRVLVAAGSLAIGAALFVFEPELARYGGLSGLAAGIVALLALVQWRTGERRWLWSGVLLVLVLKMAVEWGSAQPLLARFAGEPIHPAPLAHLAGVLAAFAVHGIGRARLRRGG